MILTMDALRPSAVYHLMTQVLVPRPIAWVLTQHSKGHLNLAPFSYFTAVTSTPPLLMLSVGNKPDGSPKDTKLNSQEFGYFVVHIPSSHHAQAVTESSRSIAATESELDLLPEMATEPFADFPLPRIKGCLAAFACRLHHCHTIPGVPETLVFGEIERVYVADSLIISEHSEEDSAIKSSRLCIDIPQLDPLARLGADDYAQLGSVFRITRPK